MDLSTLSDDQLRAMYSKQPAAPPPVGGMSDEQLKQAYAAKSPAAAGNKTWGDSATDFVKSIPGGLLSGVSNTLSAVGKGAGLEGQTDPSMADSMPSPSQTKEALETITGKLPEPQGRAGRFGAAVGEGLGNPVSYIGPGGLALKVGGSVLGSLGSEGAGQATEGTKAEPYARIVGALTGGVAGAKVLAPTVEKAVVPTAQELLATGKSGFKAARGSDLQLDPSRVSNWAATVQQDLERDGPARVRAPKVHELLDGLQAPPKGASFTAANLDDLRGVINDYAKEVTQTGPGQFTATPSAAAASKVGDRLKGYMEGVPSDHVVAGDSKNYVQTIQEANGNYAAGKRTANIDSRILQAENNAEGGIATSPDNQIKAKIRGILNNEKAQRGFSDDELAAMEKLNKGTVVSNTLRQLGRGGTGVIPMMTQAAVGIPAAFATGGASAIPQAALMASLYGAKKISEGMTRGGANDLAEMLAKRSPLYQSRADAIPSNSSQSDAMRAAIVRALMTSQ